MKIYTSVTELIGRTPLMELKNYSSKRNINARILVKLESFNPAGSIKDRVAANMIEDAERRGLLSKGAMIIEPTSGNTGIGIAAVAASKGYRAVFTMPDTMSVERRALLAAYGAEIVLTPGELGMAGAIKRAEELKAENPGSFIPGQFTNPSNPESHYNTTGPELWEDTDGNIDIFIAGVGTGGTLSGCGRFLKEKDPQIKVVAVEPADSPLLSGGAAGPHPLQGIGANFIPDTLDRNVYDEIITVTGEDAYAAGRDLAHLEGILVGITSGAALHAAEVLASRVENRGKTIAVILPDSGERYLSTPMFK